jgi:iron(III) transport system ATP-binding protein
VAFIDIASVDKRFGSFRALIGVDLSIEEHEFVTLLGPSGCGKTTMLRTLAGFLAPDAGTIYVDGRLLSSPKGVVPPEQRRMGMVFQNYAIWPHMSVFDNVAFGLRIAKAGRSQIAERVKRVLAAVGLEGLDHRHPGQLSGGQQQRVAVARALVTNPAMILADEPTGNLDTHSGAEVLGLFERLSAAGRTIILITHEEEVAAHARRVIRVRDGQIVDDSRNPVVTP